MTLAMGTRLGRYEIRSLLGAGGMGMVYRARDARLDRDVAIKVLPERFAQDPEAVARFQREGKAVAAISHPHIRAIYDIATDQGTLFAVMEYLEGETLAGRIKRGPLSWQEGVPIAKGIAEGLAAAHARGVIHRDIKPANIFLVRSDVRSDRLQAVAGSEDPLKRVTTSDCVKILDFGLARLEPREHGSGESATLTLETHPGTVMGTVHYMAPEQVRGQPADAKSDVFAFGCALYEMLSGVRPFLRGTNADTIAAILHDHPPTLAELGRDAPPALDALVSRCLAKEPHLRFESGHDLVVALNTLGDDLEQESFRFLSTQWKQPATVRGESHRTKQAGASVAVLPFLNMSADPENEYFSDGLAEELIDALTKVAGLRVASRTSAFSFKGKSEDIRKIGGQLNVRTVLEGSVRKAGNRLRIHAQLVNVADGYHLWSETYNRQLEDVFAIQDEIADSIAKALQLVLSEKDKRAIEKPPTADVRAYDYYLRGRQFFRQFRRKGFEFAKQMFTKSIEIDPRFARAYAGLAECHSFLFMYWDPSPVHLQRADEASRKALELGDAGNHGGLAEAHVARGLALTLSKQFSEAQREFEQALLLNANLFEAHYFYGRACLAQGDLARAAELFEQACRIDPDDYQAASHLGSIYAGLGRKEDCQAACRRCLQVMERRLELHPDDARAWYLGAVSWCQLNEKVRALEWVNHALHIDPEEPVTLYNIACVYALQGEAEQALGCLEKALMYGFAHKAWIENDSDLQSLRGHPRFQALLQGM